MAQAYNGSEICLTRDEQIFDPAAGAQSLQQWEGTEEAVRAKLMELGPTWRTRMSFDGGRAILEATTPELGDDGEGGSTIAGAEDQWDFTTEIIEGDFWASPGLIDNVVNLIALPGTTPQQKADSARKLMAVWRATIRDHLEFKFDPDGKVYYLGSDGQPTIEYATGRVKLKGPTAVEHFRPRTATGTFITDSASLTMLRDLYTLLFSGQTSHQTALVAISRRRTVPVDSVGRFTTTAVDTVWSPNAFVLQFKVPAHIQRLLPPVPEILPYLDSIWGYKLRRCDASATSGSVRVMEIIEWAFGAYSKLTHFIKP